MPVNILLFDDNTSLLEAFEILFAQVDDFRLLACFPDTEQLEQRILQYSPDVILMDIDIRPVNGIVATRQILTRFPAMKVVIQTVFDEDEKVFAAICAGAAGYVLKNDPPARMVDVIHDIVRGGAPMSPGIASKVLRLFKDKLGSSHAADTNKYQLTIREKEVLKWLVEGLSYKMIADRCGVSYETVKSHIKNIYQKLQVASMTEAMAKAINERLV